MTVSMDQQERVSIADPDISESEIERVRDVLESGQLSGGETVTAFESAFAEYSETRHGIATSNGTTALQTALEALDIGEGDLVVTTPFSFVATANAIRHAGATPIFADIDPATYNLDPHSVEDQIRATNGDVAAILAVHLYGLPAAMNHLADIADTYDIALIEDAAQAHGATVGGKRVGSLGDAAAFSFYPTKNMTTGEGGMVTTDRDDVAERGARFVNHGRDESYRHVTLGHNFRMSDICAALGLAQLEKLPNYTTTRRDNAARYDSVLHGSPIEGPVEPSGRHHVYHQYTVRVANREQFAAHLDDYGVDSAVYYPRPIHEQPAYDHVDIDAPVAEDASNEVISIPVHPNLRDRDLETVVTALQEYER